MQTELDKLIEEQAYDMKHGHRVYAPNQVHFTDTMPVGGYRKKPAFRQPIRTTDLVHGSISTYNNLKCRCTKCRAANAEYQRNYQRRRKGLEAQKLREEELERLAGY